MRRLSILVAVVAVFLLLGGAGSALADVPFRADERVTDRAGVLDAGQRQQVAQAIDRLRADGGTDLFVVYVESFDGLDGRSWADQSARLSQFGTNDVLLAVATGDRAYGTSYAQDFRLPESTTSAIETDDVEPRLAAGDWSGAAVAMADGLRTGGGAGGGGSGGVGVGALLVGGAAVVGGGAYLLSRRRRRRAGAEPAPADAEAAPTGTAPAPRDEFTDLTTEDLAYRSSTALIEVDDAVRTSEQELSAARGHFGDAAVAGFAAAVEQSRADMLAAFAIRQRLDDDQPEDEPTARALHAEIIRTSRAADGRLDAQVAAFDRLRDLETRAPEFVAGLGTRLDAVTARLPEAEAGWARLQERYAATALEPVAGHLDQARQLLTAAGVEVAEARAELTTPGPSAAVVSGRVAEDAITQAETLLDGVPRLGSELTDAAARVAAARTEVEQDLAEARAVGGDLAPLVARAEAALAAAQREADGPRPDPIGALRLLDETGVALDAGLDQARAGPGPGPPRRRRARPDSAHRPFGGRGGERLRHHPPRSRRHRGPHPARRGAATPAAGQQRG